MDKLKEIRSLDDLKEFIKLNKDVLKAGKGKTKCIIDKPSFSSFQLADKAAEGNYEKITIIGVCTDICVVSNALILKGRLPEVSIAVEEGLCAGVTPESHKCAVETMRMCQVDIV